MRKEVFKSIIPHSILSFTLRFHYYSQLKSCKKKTTVCYGWNYYEDSKMIVLKIQGANSSCKQTNLPFWIFKLRKLLPHKFNIHKEEEENKKHRRLQYRIKAYNCTGQQTINIDLCLQKVKLHEQIKSSVWIGTDTSIVKWWRTPIVVPTLNCD